MPTYTEYGTGNKVEAGASFDPTKKYVEYGSGRVVDGAMVESNAAMQSRVANQGKPGYDVFGNPTTGGSGTESGGYYPRYTSAERGAEDYLTTFNAPKTKEEIQQEKMTAAQERVNALNKYYDSLIETQKPINESRVRGTNAISVLTGLAGSTEAEVQNEKTLGLNKRDNDKINNERAVAIGQIFADIESSAIEEARAQRDEARKDAESILAARKERQTQATEQLKVLSMSGVTADGLKNTDPNAYDYLVRQVGGEDLLRSYITLNRPKNDVVSSQVINGKYVVAYRNPLTDKITMETLDIGLPDGYTKSPIDAGDRLLFMPDNWDGDTTKLIAINKGLTPNQAATTGDGAVDEQLYSGLSSKTATAVRSKVSAFKSEPMVQNFATIQDGYNFASSIKNDTQNPADDQALIYSLAKALDPGSVVREGEYATAQKYAQSWIAAYGKGVEQALLGTGFLSEKARENIKKVIEQKYTSTKKTYDNLYKQYEGGINTLTGRTDGSKFLVDYSTASNVTKSKVLVDKGGNAFDASDLTDDEYQQAIDDGYTPQ